VNSIWPYISFILGSIFALLLQWVSYHLSFKKDQKKEYWMRKLNSYQDFYQHTTQLIALLRSNVSIPENVYWQSIALARKAAFDAAFFDTGHRQRTERMQDVTVALITALQSSNRSQENLETLHSEIEGIQQSFCEEEGMARSNVTTEVTLPKRAPSL
jgi:dipeptidase